MQLNIALSIWSAFNICQHFERKLGLRPHEFPSSHNNSPIVIPEGTVWKRREVLVTKVTPDLEFLEQRPCSEASEEGLALSGHNRK